MEPKPSISKVFNLISQKERQRSMNQMTASSVIFQASPTVTSFEQVVAEYVPVYKQKGRPICSHCGMAGHTRCYKFHGYTTGYKTPGYQ